MAMTAAERQRKHRAQFPRQPRRVVSWVTGQHMPAPRPDGTCAVCLGRLRPYPKGGGWRHR